MGTHSDNRRNVIQHKFLARTALNHEMKFKIIAFYSYSLPKLVNDLIFICSFVKSFLTVPLQYSVYFCLFEKSEL